MALGPYRTVLAVPGLRPIVAVGLLAKLPVVAIPVLLTLHVTTGLGSGYAQAGLAVAAWTLGVTAGAPLQGRAIDRFGLRATLLVAASGQALFWGLAPALPLVGLQVGALLSGVLLVPGSTAVRLAITTLVPDAVRHNAFALDSTLTSVAYAMGPALAVLAATRLSTLVAVSLLGLVLVGSEVALALLYPRSAARPTPSSRAASVRRRLDARLLVVLGCTVAAGAIISGYEVGIVATMKELGEAHWTGLVLLCCGVGSTLGGLLLGGAARPLPVALGTALLAVAVVPLGLVGAWWLLLLAALPAAFLYTPAFSATATAVGGLATDSDRALVMSLYGAAISAGSALGAPLAGASFDHGGAPAAFGSLTALGLIAAAAAWAVLGRRSTTAATDPTIPADASPVVPADGAAVRTAVGLQTDMNPLTER